MIAFLTEFIGTFIFLAVILMAANHPTFIQPVIIVIALLAMIYFGLNTSGGHFNPAISTMFLIKGDLSVEKYIGYIVAQILGALVALLWFHQTIKSKGIQSS
jgi:aquaporin Z